MGKVTFVGAGPGDASLITVKGMEKIKSCDVIIYDRLISRELLSYAKPDAILIYAGKKAGTHMMPQEEINRLLVAYAKEYNEIVRLKGGDSFVFGRGGEEIEFLMEHKIPFEVIPGITSAVSVPELAGIPVTHRGMSRSFHVITGHTKEDGKLLKEQYQVFAKLDGSLVFLMGLSRLEEITHNLLLYGKKKELPAAVIADGAAPEEKIVRGTLGDIAERVRREKLHSPAVIVIGETAGLHFRMEEEKDIPFFGVTGTADTIQKFRNKIKRSIPLLELETVRLSGCEAMKQEFERISDDTWIFFTSKEAVEVFFELFRPGCIDIRKLGGCRFAVLGGGTGQALMTHGIYADFMPKRADSESFAKEFIKSFSGGKILFPHAKQADLKFPHMLAEAGFDVRAFSIYDVVPKCGVQFEKAGSLEKFVFFSASGVRGFFMELKRREIKLKPNSRFYCIGHKTEQALKEVMEEGAGWKIITAKIHSVEGLIAEIADERPID